MIAKCFAITLAVLLFMTSCSNRNSDILNQDSTNASKAVSLDEALATDNSNYQVQSTVDDIHLKYVGLWQSGSFDVGSGYSERYLLLPDSTFVYAESQFKATNRLRFMYGDWRIEDNILHMTIKSKVFREGGNEIEDGTIVDKFIEGGHIAIYIYDQNDFEYIDYSIKDMKLDNDDSLSIFLMGESEYYRLPHDVLNIPRAEIYYYSACT